MRRAVYAIAAAALLAGTASLAAKDGPGSLLGPADLDPALVLPAPPAMDSLQGRQELAELHAVEQARTPEQLADARHDDEVKDVSIFAEVLGPQFDLAKLPATAALFAIVRATEKDVADRGKGEFQRRRPWIVDPSIKPCDLGDKPLSSYPSGHTTMGYSMAGILVRLVPSKAAAILARAARYGEGRIVCQQHFRSDVTAGEALGLLVAERLMAKPEFLAAYAKAKAELEAAGIR